MAANKKQTQPLGRRGFQRRPSPFEEPNVNAQQRFARAQQMLRAIAPSYSTGHNARAATLIASWIGEGENGRIWESLCTLGLVIPNGFSWRRSVAADDIAYRAY